MNPQKWIKNNLFGVTIGALISVIVPLDLNIVLKLIVGSYIGGLVQSSQKSSTSKKIFGIAPFVGWLIVGIIGAIPIIASLFQKQPPTLTEQLAEIPMWAWFIAGFFLLLLIKALKKKPRTIIIQEQR